MSSKQITANIPEKTSRPDKVVLGEPEHDQVLQERCLPRGGHRAPRTFWSRTGSPLDRARWGSHRGDVFAAARRAGLHEKAAARGTKHPFKTLFANSAFANGPLAGLTGALDSIPLDYEYRFTQYPPGWKIEGSTEYVLKRALAMTSTPDEFRSRAIGVIPKPVHHEGAAFVLTSVVGGLDSGSALAARRALCYVAHAGVISTTV
jgi:hypothetical protein